VEITLNMQTIFTGLLVSGGGAIIFFLQRIYTQFERVVERLNENIAKTLLHESQIRDLRTKVTELDERIHELAGSKRRA
jgi:hypothetical protein